MVDMLQIILYSPNDGEAVPCSCHTQRVLSYEAAITYRQDNHAI